MRAISRFPRLETLSLIAAILNLGAPVPEAPAQSFEAADAAPNTGGALTNSEGPLLEVQFPNDGAVVDDPVCGLFVAGRAGIRRDPADVIIAIDTSLSTIESSGADIDGDGSLGRPRVDVGAVDHPIPSTDPQDSILAAEVEAARRILAGLDFAVDRVGVVTFSGEKRTLAFWRRRAGAQTVLPLTDDEDRIRTALDAIAASEPQGGTDLGGAIDEVVSALSRRRREDPAARAVVYFFTDGQPTLPLGPHRLSENVRASLEAIDRAVSSGIRIDSFGIGREALEGPIVLVEMANRTNGTFTPVRHPGDLVDIVGDPSLSALDQMTVRNTTTGRWAHHWIARTDGSWVGFVAVADGENRIEAVATSTDGSRTVYAAVVHNDSERQPTPIPDSLRLQREELLEDCLRAATRKRLELEDEQLREVRERLLDEIQREREAANRRSREQRKSLELDVEDLPGE